jgi:acylphosphatase
MTRTTRRVIYEGTVQGVAFRRRAVEVAERYPVTGYVKNLDDGTVELVADGEPRAVEAFLAHVAQRMHREIRTTRESAAEPESFPDFSIRR